jgi:hypothetical protein
MSATAKAVNSRRVSAVFSFGNMSSAIFNAAKTSKTFSPVLTVYVCAALTGKESDANMAAGKTAAASRTAIILRIQNPSQIITTSPYGKNVTAQN